MLEPYFKQTKCPISCNNSLQLSKKKIKNAAVSLTDKFSPMNTLTDWAPSTFRAHWDFPDEEKSKGSS